MLTVRNNAGRCGDAVMLRAREELLQQVFDQLLSAFGPQHWWPAETPFEVIAGAILTQNTAWKNVEKAIAALRHNQLLEVDQIRHIPEADLAALIRPSGYYNQKARKLKHFCNYLSNHWQGDLQRFLGQDLETLRAQLLRLHGIGPETADSIALYAAGQPSFVVDVYTHRIFSRHGWIPEELGYHELRRYFMDCLPAEVNLFKEYHALLVRTGHHFCRRKPACNQCPLRDR
jgi:endonuclease III related protein